MLQAIQSSRPFRKLAIETGLAPLLLLSGGFWILLPWTTGGHPPSLCLSGDNPFGRMLFSGRVLIDGGIASATLTHWSIMAGAMMLPLLAPAAKYVHDRSFRQRRLRAQALLALGFLAIWALLGLGSLLLLMVATAWSAALWLSGLTVIGAILWQLSLQRKRLIRRCRTASSLSPRGIAADLDCARYGASQALACARTCLPAMYAMSLSPAGHLAALPMTWLMLRERSQRDWPTGWMVGLLFLLAAVWLLPGSLNALMSHSPGLY